MLLLAACRWCCEWKCCYNLSLSLSVCLSVCLSCLFGVCLSVCLSCLFVVCLSLVSPLTAVLSPPDQRCATVCLNSFGNQTSPSDSSNDRWKRLCLVGWAAAPCVWTLRALTGTLLTYLQSSAEHNEAITCFTPEDWRQQMTCQVSVHGVTVWIWVTWSWSHS